MWSDICQQIWPELKPDRMMAASLLCMLMMCMKLCNLHINCCVVMTVI